MFKRFIVLIVVVACVYTAWSMLRPVTIVAVHDGNTIIVENFPLLKSRQIAWWEENKKMIKDKYDIPLADKDGYYAIYIQGFGDGYRMDSQLDQDSDLLCFKDMPVKDNCIEKDPLLTVGNARNAPNYFE
ncbi:DUF943 family protein [Erwinia amylovora]